MYQDSLQMVKRTSIVLVMILLGAIACTPKPKTGDPAIALENYIKIAINAKSGSDRQRLFDYTTGKALERLQQMSDEDFLQNLVKPEFKFVHFSTRDQRKEADGKVSLVYELVYENSKGDVSAKITNRKIAYLTKDSAGAWKIEDTRNVKSYMEMKDGMNIQYP